MKPSRRAAASRRSSNEMNSRVDGRASAAKKAAASWRASAVRRSWTRSNLMAESRTSSPGSTSCQPALKAVNRTKASRGKFLAELSQALLARNGRCALDLGCPPGDDDGIRVEKFLHRPLMLSGTSRGITAELSQNLIALPAAL